MIFNEKLRMLRKEKGLSQEDLADLVGVSRQAMSKWESGQTYPEMDKVVMLSEIFGVTIDSMVKDKETEKDDENDVSAPFWMVRGQRYERKSKRMLFGLPLLHVNIGYGRKVKGIVAVGNRATGIIAVGLVAKGIVSVGVLSLGIFSFGSLCIGLLSIGAAAIGLMAGGAIAVGYLAFGAIAIGVVSFGACAVASQVAVGAVAIGKVAIGREAIGSTTLITNASDIASSDITAAQVRAAIAKECPSLGRWLVDLIAFFFNK